MPGVELIRSFLQQANAQGSRSTALNPLGWALAIILSALLGALWAKAPIWVVSTLVVFAGIVLLFYVFAYCYFMFKAPDALRSERFSLSKMAIERSMTGDSLKGFAELDKENYALLPVSEPTDSEKQ